MRSSLILMVAIIFGNNALAWQCWVNCKAVKPYCITESGIFSDSAESTRDALIAKLSTTCAANSCELFTNMVCAKNGDEEGAWYNESGSFVHGAAPTPRPPNP